ncbi:alpha/beta hydrolase, partial [Staphylococcus pasteuri]
LKEKDVPVDTLFYNGSHHLHHQYQFHLEKPESKENIKRVLLFLSRNTSSSGVERNNESNTNGNNNINQDVQLDPFSE